MACGDIAATAAPGTTGAPITAPGAPPCLCPTVKWWWVVIALVLGIWVGRGGD